MALEDKEGPVDTVSFVGVLELRHVALKTDPAVGPESALTGKGLCRNRLSIEFGDINLSLKTVCFNSGAFNSR